MSTSISLSLGSDIDAQMRVAEESLRRGHTVKLHFRFRGHEMAHPEIGLGLVRRTIFRLAPLGRAVAEPKLIGRNIRATVSPVR